MNNKKYWQNFGDLTQSERFQEDSKKEFKEELLPLEDLDSKGLLDAKTPRRDFLKYLGFSTAAAALAASCEMPVRKAVPYLHRPDDLIPGVPNYYASTYVNAGDAISVVVKQRDGRPIKIEGNELSTITKGGTSAQAQASVLDLYDPTRLRHPLQKSGSDFKEVTSFDAFDKMVGDAIASVAGKPLVLLTSTINSPSTLDIITAFLAKYPGSRHVQYDAVSYSGMLLANEACYGKRSLPVYQFDKAKTIVSLGADFLGTWLNPVEFSRQYADTKRIIGEKPELSRHIQFESMISMTGSNADDRFVHKPSDTGAIALALLAKVGGAVTAPAIADAKLSKGIDLAASALNASKGSGLVVCSSNDVNIQIIVNAINEAIGAGGNTINWAATTNSRKGIDADMVKLVADINNGSIGGLLVYDCNPVFTYTDGKKLGEAIAKLPLSVSFNLTMDETTEQCKYILPSNHWLESWGDAEPRSGYISVIQPLINPLFKTRPFQTSLLKWSTSATATVAAKDSTGKAVAVVAPGVPHDVYETYHKNYWLSKLGSTDSWDKALQDGVVEPSTPAVSAASYNASNVSAAASKIVSKAGAIEVVLYQKVSIGTGAQANNPWLQELPDPVTKVTWDNYAMLSPDLAKKLIGIDVAHNQREADAYEVHPEKPVLKITLNNKTIELPALIMPGMQNATIAIAVGYGRASISNTDREANLDRIGRAAYGAGKNAYPLVSFDGSTFIYNAVATVEKTGDTYPLAQTQVHGFTEGRPIVYETNLASFIANPEALLEEPNEERKKLVPTGKTDYIRDATIYPNYAKPGIKWGMSIDLNTCTGCSACVVACTAENNVSVVGKTQVQRAHEMHWLRIDRYFVGDLENPDVLFQPMLCQHCDNAPCENVCPVAATNHSSEGLNQMIYNRCIGTRYCANNCPYKVRRFNWLDFTGSDSFPNNQEPIRNVDLDEAVFQMNDDLARMVLNPDVTVRSRGVMEKCSFCVQRLQDSKLEAKKQQDPTLVRNVKTACMQACPTNAISFGNVNDKDSDVYKIRNVEQTNRNFYVIEQLHTLPNVSYLAKIRNTDRKVETDEETQEEKLQHQKSES
ncbi:MAG: TAT-variant-translocated molybdopterin oxidoreductase [Bacteroidetes bacterium]|nr:TAT-variant-translocated molybdopterin oxidoreductase [Bacteroidota bacterium]MBS1757623.1 TAT-variant-translocated molybdopterin oxidoreductase [Bacteroidota bacterium]